MELILNNIRSLPQYQNILTQLKAGKQIAGLGLPRAARLPVLAALLEDIKQPILFITDRADHALSMFDELGFWVKSPRYHFAEPNPLFYEQAAWGVTTRRDRLQALTAISNYHLPITQKPESPPVIIASVRSLMTRTMPRRDFLKACKKLSVNQSIQPDTLLRSWAEIGYQRVNTVLEPGQFSSRGGILDIWATAETMPVRLDVFGDEIETIRKFDPASQRTIEKLDSVLVTPAREYLAVGEHETELSEFHIPLLHSQPATLLDYLPQRAVVLIDDVSIIESMAEEIEAQAVKFRQDSIAEETLSADFPLPYVPWSELYDGVQGGLVELGYSTREGAGEQRLETRDFEELLASHFGHDERFGGRLKNFVDYVAGLISKKESVIIVSRQAKRLEELWGEANQTDPASEPPLFIESSLSEGFTLSLQSPVANHLISIHLISDSEIFGWERPQPRTRQRPAAETPESVYADLNVGDYVVHIDHGVGRFGGLVTRELDNHAREFLAVEYDGGGQLYVPVHQADRLTRYVGAEGAMPALDRLGGQEWHEKKGRVKAAVLEVAQDMLDLYARRNVALGYSFKPD
ncbi:MAG: hypothetical protein IT315_11835, partial [Anaerolineales bacterium]|nr:hypothetical protein [Anaerolineales bacterium]